MLCKALQGKSAVRNNFVQNFINVRSSGKEKLSNFLVYVNRFAEGKIHLGTLITKNKNFDFDGKTVNEFELFQFQFNDFSILFFSQTWSGCERTLNPETNLMLNDFIGSFRNGAKSSEGQRFYDNGIYDESWRNNKRSGWGTMCYNTSKLYFGEWDNGVYSGPKILVKGEHNELFGKK